MSSFFSFWNISGYFIPKITIFGKYEKPLNLNQLKMTLSKAKTIRNNLLKKDKKYLPWVFLSNLDFSIKPFNSQDEKSNFYQLIKFIIKNFYIFLITNYVGKTAHSILKNFFRDIIHHRNSNSSLSLKNIYCFKMLIKSEANK